MVKNRKTCANCVFVNRYVTIEPYESHLSCALTEKWVAPTNYCEHHGTSIGELTEPVENEISKIKRVILRCRAFIKDVVSYIVSF